VDIVSLSKTQKRIIHFEDFREEISRLNAELKINKELNRILIEEIEEYRIGNRLLIDELQLIKEQ
jgi:hypothetical protein